LPRRGQKTVTIPEWVWKLIVTLQELVRRIELWMETVYREIYVVSGLEYLKIKEKMIEERKELTIKTLVDTGTTINFVDFGNGRQAFIFREEKFGGLQIWGVRLGWSENYRVIAPEELTRDTISVFVSTSHQC